MFSLARELVGQGRTVITTTTTKIFWPSAAQSPCVLSPAEDSLLETLDSNLNKFGHVSVGRNLQRSPGKLGGIDEHTLERCLKFAHHVVVEADGARGRSIKAPEEWEPVIPRQTDLVVVVVGLDCLGKPVTRENVFRLEKFVSITGVHKNQTITPEAVAILLSHPLGGLKGVKGGVMCVPFLNKVDLVANSRWIAQTAKYILARRLETVPQVVAGSLFRGISAFRTFES